MKPQLATAAVALSLAIPVFQAQAAVERLDLNYGDRELRGNTTLRLKQELNRHHPRLLLNRAELLRVLVVAKSQRGAGTVALEIDGRRETLHRISGSPAWYESRDPRTFSRIILNNPMRRSDGTWQLEFRGQIKLRSVHVWVDTDRAGPRPGGQIRSVPLPRGCIGGELCLRNELSVPLDPRAELLDLSFTAHARVGDVHRGAIRISLVLLNGRERVVVPNLEVSQLRRFQFRLPNVRARALKISSTMNGETVITNGQVRMRL